MYEKKITLIYLFMKSVDAETTEEGLKKAKPIATQCRNFARAMKIPYRDDHWGALDGKFPFRFSFSIHGKQNAILPQVAALFSFAASLELSLVNQLFYTDEE